MDIYWLYILAPGIIFVIGILFLIRELLSDKPFIFTWKENEGKTNSLALIVSILALIFLFKGIRNYKFESYFEKLHTAELQNIIPKKNLSHRNVINKKTIIKVQSNLLPFLNDLLEKKLTSIAENIHDTLSKTIIIRVSYPTKGFLYPNEDMGLNYYLGGAKISVKSNCGDFEIDSDYIGESDKYPLKIVTNHLIAERNRIVKKHIDQICKKLKPCLF